METHHGPRTEIWIVAALPIMLAFILFLASCGGENGSDTTSAPTDAAETTDNVEPANDTSAPSSGSGSGTLVVDEQTFEFEVIFCGFTPEETRSDSVPFSFRGNGTDASGRAYSVDAAIITTDVAGLMSESHTVSFWYDDANTVIVYETSNAPQVGADDRPKFLIDGKQVKYEGNFAGEDGASVGVGKLDANCP